MPPTFAPDAVASVFTDAVGRAVRRDLPVEALIGVAETLNAAGQAALVAELYRIWIAHNQDAPLLHAVLYNLGTALNHAGQDAQAAVQFAAAIERRPDFVPGHIALGAVLERTGDAGGAVARWLHVADLLAGVTGDSIHQRVTALKQAGRVLESAENLLVAEELLRRCLDIDPGQRDAGAHWLSMRQRQCKWPVLEPWGQVRREHLLAAISPLSLSIWLDDPIFQLANAHRYYRQDVARNKDGTGRGIGTAGGWPPPAAPRAGRPLRIGYLSSDLREHAIGFLTAEIFGLHDRARAQPVAYYCGPPRETDRMQQRIRREVGEFVDLAGLTDKQAAARMVADRIDILVDINGYTRDARTPVVALRPAPIIVNWLGYPGSLATPDHHYIIADDTIIPPGYEAFYTERVVRLPCYQPNDRLREIVPDRPTRAEAGLPEDAVVFCCFNGTQKITPPVFAAWMRILHAVPGSVLWLLSSAGDIEARLRAAAEAQGIAPERLVFAARLLNQWHLARYPLADLFLDTWPYGAHTTASDALWMGVPVLTYAGLSFASRVCASLTRAAGLPDLVCADLEAYVARAIALGQDAEARTALRARLAASRATCALFDTARLVRTLEDLYDGMWRDYAAGALPQPDLTNLSLYHEIALDRAMAGAEAARQPDLYAYLRQYADARAYHAARALLPDDPRVPLPPARPDAVQAAPVPHPLLAAPSLAA